jgi:hypothetical protein
VYIPVSQPSGSYFYMTISIGGASSSTSFWGYVPI